MPRKPKALPPPPPEPKRHERAWSEGSVTQTPNGKYRAFRARVHHADGTSSRPSRMFSSRELAEAWAKGDTEPDVLLLGHWLDRWLALAAPTLRDGSVLLYRRDIAEVGDLALRPLAELTTEDWQAQTNRLLERWERSTVVRWRDTLSTALKAAIPRYLASNPLARVRLPRGNEQPVKAWRRDEVTRLLAAAAGHQHEPWLLFCLGTGVRIGESRALLWEDVDLRAGTAVIRASLDNRTSKRGPTKTGKVRTVEIPDNVVRVLSAHRKRQRPDDVYVFGRRGSYYHANTFREWLNRMCKAAKVTELSPHGLRHTCASLAFDAGVPVQDVAHQLGHSVQVCQRTYTHFIGAGLRRMSGALETAMQLPVSGPKRRVGSQNGTRGTR